jgi:hypothetical protein
VKDNYNYTREFNKNAITIDELREQGGNCVNYANFYNTFALEHGYLAQNVSVSQGTGRAHRIAIVSDITGYCVADQRRLFCVVYPKDLESTE